LSIRDRNSSGKLFAGTLETVSVIGYGPDPEYNLNTSDNNIIEITLSGEDKMLINGKKVQWEDLKREISNEAKILSGNNIKKNQIIASIRADEKTKMGQVAD